MSVALALYIELRNFLVWMLHLVEPTFVIRMTALIVFSSVFTRLHRKKKIVNEKRP